MSTIGELSKRLQSRRQHVEPFLNKLFLQLTTIHPVETSEIDNTSVNRYNEMDSNSEAKEGNSVDKGKSYASEVAAVSGAYSQSSKETQNKGKGSNKSKKKNRSKGSRKK
ncbi:hypothetical protein CIPAW_05G204100 [Carya illinoinensis]|nr:hypothetical protein CIPAW_05G204100 [Carya illinoinensis]